LVAGAPPEVAGIDGSSGRRPENLDGRPAPLVELRHVEQAVGSEREIDDGREAAVEYLHAVRALAAPGPIRTRRDSPDVRCAGRRREALQLADVDVPAAVYRDAR